LTSVVAPARLAHAQSTSSGDKPNILVIFGDDIGQSDISVYTFGLMGFRAPNIDRIAREGMMFTDYYAEQSCTAGRSSFITGQSVLRTGLNFDPTSGHEFSAVTGVSYYNFVNPSTVYRNGIDWHIDWAASQFLSKTVQVGAVGYFFQQLTADRGAAQFLGGNLSHVAGIGPQVGFFFPAGPMQGYLNLKGFRSSMRRTELPVGARGLRLPFRPSRHESGGLVNKPSWPAGRE
jgi:hypothetical protein